MVGHLLPEGEGLSGAACRCRGSSMGVDEMGTVSATPAALDLIAEIVDDHGPVMFHQSGGCCDGSPPLCYAQGDFLIGDYDVKMGEIGGAPFYISSSQY